MEHMCTIEVASVASSGDFTYAQTFEPAAALGLSTRYFSASSRFAIGVPWP